MSTRVLTYLACSFWTITNLLGQGGDFQAIQTNACNVRLSMSNFGTFGNSFDGYRDGSGTPSCEYPAGSGIEHLFEGGIWVGGKQNGGQVRVTTSSLDNPTGYVAGAGGFETYSFDPVEIQSSLFDSRYYNAGATSHQDYISTFYDTVRFYPNGSGGSTGIPVGGSDHEPMGLKITMSTYNWNYLFSDFVVFVDLVIENVGDDFYDDVYVGLWNNTVVRNVNVTPAGSGGADFYNKGGNGYMEEHQMAYCYDAAGDVGFTDSYIGQKFMGAKDKEGFHHPDIDSNFNPSTGQWELDDFKVAYNAWIFNDFTAQFAAPANELARYNKLNDGLNESPCWTDPNDPSCPGNLDFQSLLNAAGNRSDLVGAGPFAQLLPGDKITISFAYILAQKK